MPCLDTTDAGAPDAEAITTRLLQDRNSSRNAPLVFDFFTLNNFFVLINLESNGNRKGDSMSDDEAYRTVNHICNCVDGLENAVINHEHSTGAQQQQWRNEVQRHRDNIIDEVLLLTKSGGNRGS
mgnify:CR=1 FL=1